MRPARNSDRIKSLFIDYLVIMGFAIVLFLVNIAFQFITFGGFIKFTPLGSQLTSFFTLVFPVFLYFVISESKGKCASFGKQCSQIHVEYVKPGVFRIICRNILKLLPWQLAHFAVIDGIYNGFDSIFVMSCYALSLILPIIYILMVLIRKDHKHIPDILAGSIVVSN